MRAVDAGRGELSFAAAVGPQWTEDERRRRLRLVYFVGVPVTFGACFGWAQFGTLAAAMPREISVIYCATISMLLWQLKWMVAATLRQAGAPGRLPWPLLLPLAAVLAEFLARPLHRAVVSALSPVFDASPPAFAGWMPLSAGEFATMLVAYSPTMLAWILTTAFYERWLGVTVLPAARDGAVRHPVVDPADVAAPPSPMPSARPAHSPSRAPSPAPSSSLATSETTAPAPAVEFPSRPFVERLPGDCGAVRVLRALDHYVEVQCAAGSLRLLHRFEDAAREMASHGLLRVHRSFCIDARHVAGIERRGRRHLAVMPGGIKVPVSSTYLPALLSARPMLAPKPRRGGPAALVVCAPPPDRPDGLQFRERDPPTRE
jgi:hypothetical protein